METRKVQITGKSTYIISLPKTWVKKVQITNGDSVVLVPRSDGTLLINPRLSKGENIIHHVIECDGLDMDTIFRKFIGAYLAGYNMIELTSKTKLSPEIRQKIRSMTHQVIGPEIIDETSDMVKIKDLLDSSDLSLLQGLKRMYIITRGMHRDAIMALKESDEMLASDVESRDDEVDRFYWIIAKQYNQVLNDMFFADKMGVRPQEVLGHLLVARSIERIADHAKKLAGFTKLVPKDAPLIDDIVEVSESIVKVFDESITAFNRTKFDLSNEVVDKCRGLVNRTELLREQILSMQGGDPAMVVALAYIVDSLERTRAYVLDIAETAINHQFSMGLNKSRDQEKKSSVRR